MGLFKNEMEQIVAVCKEKDVISKVIFENCYLTKEEIKQLALIAKEVKPDFIKQVQVLEQVVLLLKMLN